MAPRINEGTRLLREYMATPGSKGPLRIALAVGVGLASVYRWKAGKVPKSVAARRALQRATGGAVPESAWDE